MDSTNSAKKDSRSVAEPEAARKQAEQQAAAQAQQQAQQAAQQAQADAQGVEQALAQQYSLPMPGTRAIASVPGFGDNIPGIVESIEEDPDEGGYSLRFIPDKIIQEGGWELPPYIDLSPNNGRTMRPEPSGTGAIDAPLVAQHAADVDAAVQQNTHPNPSGPKNTFLENDERQSLQPKGGGMLRFLIPVLIAAGLGYWAYSMWEDHLESERMQQSVKAREQALKISMIEMASKVNAVTDWAQNLVGAKKSRSSPVLTAELQKQWVINRPIFLLGNIKDIAINQDGTYQVTVEYNWVVGRPMFMQNDIRMNLRCPESVALPLIQAAKARSLSAGLSADTAITAVIDHIVTTSEKDSAGDTTTVLTGVGRCLDAMYFTERISWP